MKTQPPHLYFLCAITTALTFVCVLPVQAQSTASSAVTTSTSQAATAATGADNAADVPPNPFGPKPEPSDADKAAAQAALANMAGTAAGPKAGGPVRPMFDKVTIELRQLLLQRFDKNGAGTLDAAEIEEARRVISGRKDFAPLAPAVAAQAVRGPLFGLRPLIMRLFDKNGDGTLDASELAAFRAALAVPAAAPGSPQVGAKEDLATLRLDILKHFNADGTGLLTDAEKAAEKAWLQQMLAELDKNNAPASQADVPVPASPAPAVNVK